jgi:predicted AAA+ superfamily ATPase
LKTSRVWVAQLQNSLDYSAISCDILDFEKIHDFKAIQLILELLRSRTGTPVSYQSLAEDAGVAPNTVKKYIRILESLFVVFRVTRAWTSPVNWHHTLGRVEPSR